MIDFITLALYGHIVLNSKSEIGLVLKSAKVKKLCLLRCKQKKIWNEFVGLDPCHLPSVYLQKNRK